MRVEFATTNPEPAERNKTIRAGQTRAASQASASASAATAEDRTQFSFDPARVGSLKAQALAAPEIRQAKVGTLGQAIADGAYSLDAAKVAEAITAEYNGGRIR